MKLNLQFKDYLGQMREFSNETFDLGLAVEPFDIPLLSKASDFLMMGHICEALAERLAPHDPVDFIDVVTTAADLGDEDAIRYLPHLEDFISLA